jgi:AAA15 family ATPase/GTPase
LTAPDPSPAPPAPPERLSHLKVAGFRSIRDLDIDLGDLTVLVGANGSGKSNFVGFFNLLSAMLYAGTCNSMFSARAAPRRSCTTVPR